VSARIHPTAVVDAGAQVGEGAEVGPYAVIGPEAVIGAGTVIRNHVTVMGRTRIGQQCQVFPGAVLGGPPQDLKYKGAPATLEIGDHNVLREFCTLNHGTELGGGRTVVGSHNLIMAYVHIAHDCHVHDHVVLANAVQLAGHVHVYDGARVSGMAGVHQFVRLGRCCYVAGLAKLSIDVPPFTLAEGQPARIRTLNLEGLRRRGLSGPDLDALKKAFRLLFRSPGAHREEAYRKIEENGLAKFPLVVEFVKFVQETDRGVSGRGLEAHRAEVPPEQRDGSLSFRVAQCGAADPEGLAQETEQEEENG
jgi:UDP-N-acetylglucosamine acyltransferase